MAKKTIEWLWVQDRQLSSFRCLTDPQFIVCYPATKSEEQHDLELINFQKELPMAQVIQDKKRGVIK